MIGLTKRGREASRALGGKVTSRCQRPLETKVSAFGRLKSLEPRSDCFNCLMEESVNVKNRLTDKMSSVDGYRREKISFDRAARHGRRDSRRVAGYL